MTSKSMPRSRFAFVTLLLLLFALFSLNSFAQDFKKKIRPKKSQQIVQLQKVSLKPESVRFNIVLPSKTTVELWDGRGTPGKEFFSCLEEVFVEKGHSSLDQWWVQWSTEENGVAKAIYQVALFPYSNDLENWQNPAGLLRSDYIEKIGPAGPQALFTIDLEACLPGNTVEKVVVTKPSVSRLKLRNQVQVKPVAKIQPAKRFQANQLQFQRIVPARINLPLAVTFHVRIITLDAAGNMVGTPSKAAIFKYVSPGDSNITWYGDPSPNYDSGNHNYPYARILDYTPYQPWMSDWDRHFVVTEDVPMLHYTKGQKVYFPRDDGSKSGWDVVKDALGSMAGFVVDAVNWVSGAYDSLKEKALEAAVYLASSTVGCGSECEMLLSVGLDYGLACLGMPPSLPNFDELQSMGKDYLIKQVAAQGSPILNEEMTKEAMKVIEREIKNYADHGPNGNSFLRIDPENVYKDALLRVEIYNESNKPTDPFSMSLRQWKPIFDFPYSEKELLIPVPPLDPGEKLIIPIVLRPNHVQANNGKGYLVHDWKNLFGEWGVMLQLYPKSKEGPNVYYVKR